MKKQVNLMLTCLCDSFFGEVGIATVNVLEYAGCEVNFNPDQTCCGQPPFNAGSWEEARTIARHCQKTLFQTDRPVVAPSASCTAMVRDNYSLLFPDAPILHPYELAEFLVHQLNLKSWPATKPYPKKIAVHSACHGRSIGLKNEQEQLLSSIPELTILPVQNPEQCCGFGGSFAALQGKVSSEIGLEKLRLVVDSGAEELVGGDMGCLMHLQGLIDRHRLPLQTRHFAQILAEVVEP